MNLYPKARDLEFVHILQALNDLNEGLILDIPSGGGYMQNHFNNNFSLILADFSEGFAKGNIQLEDPTGLSFANNSFDAVLSLSGMHHLENVILFVDECLRVVKPNGKFIFADVKKDTPIDYFLNVFVNEYNPLGHNGSFFYESYFESIPHLMQQICEVKYNQYPFVFDNEENAIHFFRLFFGLERAHDAKIKEGIYDILGVENSSENDFRVKWGLLRFVMQKKS